MQCGFGKRRGRLYKFVQIEGITLDENKGKNK
jgi:hypothetical protein